MTKRAIILVPGFEKNEHLAVRDQLVDAIVHYGSGYRVERSENAGLGSMEPAALRATSRNTDEVAEIHIYEAYWGDLIPDWSEESPWARFKRGLLLIWFWAFGGAFRAILRGETPTRTVFAMMIAALMLLAWYLTVVTVLIQTIGSGDTGLPEALAAMMERYTPLATALSFINNLNSIPVFLFIMGLVSLGRVEGLANLSSFVKDYLRDEPPFNAQVGIRAKTRARLTGLLDHVTGAANDYTDVHVVAHSLGGAISVDALANFGRDLPKVTLHTWGTGLGLLVQQSEWVERKIAHLYEADPTLADWIDIVYPNDVMASQRPRPRAYVDEKRQRKRMAERFTPTFWPPAPRRTPFSYAAVHASYFRCELGVEKLLCCEPPTAEGKAVTRLPLSGAD